MVTQDGLVSLGLKFINLGAPKNLKMVVLHNYLMMYIDNDYNINFMTQRDRTDEIGK